MAVQSRRDFLSTATCMGLCALAEVDVARFRRALQRAHVPGPIHVLVLGRSGELARHATPLDFAAAEGTRSAALLGARLVLTQRALVDGVSTDAREAHAMLDGADDAHALLALVEDAALLGALGAAARARGRVVINAACTSDALRDTRCHPELLHVVPAESQVARALERARARADDGASGVALRVATWHPALVRFGAAQLNERYERHAGEAMDDAAWTTWFATKLIIETALRSRAADAAALSGALRRPGLAFDGHKGVPLAFDPATGELRQPLYVVAAEGPDERVAMEIPQPEPVVRGGSARCASNTGSAPAAR